ncbi:hypothetical protein RIF29_32953 [Crotalaria pallida]|uniref:Uncharacterized protein n=1 Tax=Crotalaria pallida TaxID=3830 RepID=A0AAN9EA49_CROPI
MGKLLFPILFPFLRPTCKLSLVVLTYFQHPDEHGLGAGQASNSCVERYVRPRRSCRQSNTEAGPDRARKAADLERKRVEEEVNKCSEAQARLARIKVKALKYKRLAEQNFLFWQKSHGEQFLNVVSQLLVLKPDLRVLGSHRFFDVKEDKLIDRRSEEPVEVDLTFPDLLDPRQFELDTTKFDKSVIVLSDSEAEAEG